MSFEKPDFEIYDISIRGISNKFIISPDVNLALDNQGTGNYNNFDKNTSHRSDARSFSNISSGRVMSEETYIPPLICLDGLCFV